MKPCVKQMRDEHFQKVVGHSSRLMLFGGIVAQTQVLAACNSFIKAIRIPPACVVAIKAGLTIRDNICGLGLIGQFPALCLGLFLVYFPEPAAQMFGQEGRHVRDCGARRSYT
jgi:hypothetical protein